MQSQLKHSHRRMHMKRIFGTVAFSIRTHLRASSIVHVIFLNGKNFCLRGCSEHCEFKLSQFCLEVFKVDGQFMVRYTYFKQLQTANKVVHQYESDHMDRCHVHILDTYISQLLNGTKEKEVLYLKPRTITPEDSSAPWFVLIPVGWNSLGAMVKTMASQGPL